MRARLFGGSCSVLLVTLLTLLVVASEASAQAASSPESLITMGGGDAKTREQEPEQQESEEEFKRHKILFLYATGWVRQGDPSADRLPPGYTSLLPIVHPFADR